MPPLCRDRNKGNGKKDACSASSSDAADGGNDACAVEDVEEYYDGGVM
jgi:hypothetical protein